MKKVFKKILILTCLVVLFITPTTTYAATSQPTLISDTDMSIAIAYLPDPLHLTQNEIIDLKNLKNPYTGFWPVTQGKQFKFQVDFAEPCTYIIFILKYNEIVYSQEYTGTDTTVIIEPNNSEYSEYQVEMIPVSANCNIVGYSQLFF